MTAVFATVKKSHNDWETQPRNHGEWGSRGGGESNTQRRIRLANKAPLITGITPLDVNDGNYLRIGNDYLAGMRKEIASRTVICKTSGKRLVKITPHIYVKRHTLKSKILRTTVLPFVIPIIEKYGEAGKITTDPKGDYQEIVGKAELKDEKGNLKKIGIAVIVADDGKGSKEIKFISVFVIESGLIKSCPTGVLADTCHTSGDSQSRRLAHDLQSPTSKDIVSRANRNVNKAWCWFDRSGRFWIKKFALEAFFGGGV